MWSNLIGNQPAYGIADLLFGLNKGNFAAELYVDNAFDKRAQLYRFVECTMFLPGSAPPGTPICGLKPFANINTPRTIGVRFGQNF